MGMFGLRLCKSRAVEFCLNSSRLNSAVCPHTCAPKTFMIIAMQGLPSKSPHRNQGNFSLISHLAYDPALAL
jgi:hypothetical protein